MRAAMAFCLFVAACSAPSPSPRRPPNEAIDKETLYGDPGLVPSREGEQARRELATAGEIANAIKVLPAVEEVRVDVERRPDLPEAIAIVVRLSEGGSSEQTRIQITSIVAAVAGQEAAGDAEVIVAVPSPSDVPDGTQFPIALALALVGFGASMGVTADRLVLRRLRRPRRR